MLNPIQPTSFCTLTAANELELMSHGPTHWQRYGAQLRPLFTSAWFRRQLLTAAADDISRVPPAPSHSDFQGSAPGDGALFWSILLAAPVALFSMRYLGGDWLLAPDVVANRYAHPWLALHAGAASTALLLGALQFFPPLRRSGSHRWVGRLFVASVLLGGASGLVLALGVVAGPLATAGFGTLALAWVGGAIAGWRAARRRDPVRHRRWMVRAWSLTLSPRRGGLTM
jgi:hypothetical protein